MSSGLSAAECRDLRAAHDRDAWAGEWNGLPTAVDRIVATREAAACQAGREEGREEVERPLLCAMTDVDTTPVACRPRGTAMTALAPEPVERLANALHERIDGDFLVSAGRSIGHEGEDVAITEARVSEIVWWAIDATAPIVAALITEAVDQARADERKRVVSTLRAAAHRELELSRINRREMGYRDTRRLAFHEAARIAARIARGES